MSLPEIFGFIASGLVLATFSMRTMIPLRLLGIGSNLAFITYGFLAGLLPVLILHVMLLPLNIYRFFEMWRLIRELKQAEDGPHRLAALLPFMSSVSLPSGASLFKKGEPADAMYILTSGRVFLPELDIEIGPGEMVGEIGLFSAGGLRIASAVAKEDCRLQRITRDRMRELVFQNPRIGFHLIGLVTSRLVDNLRAVEQRGEQPAAGAGV